MHRRISWPTSRASRSERTTRRGDDEELGALLGLRPVAEQGAEDWNPAQIRHAGVAAGVVANQPAELQRLARLQGDRLVIWHCRKTRCPVAASIAPTSVTAWLDVHRDVWAPVRT